MGRHFGKIKPAASNPCMEPNWNPAGRRLDNDRSRHPSPCRDRTAVMPDSTQLPVPPAAGPAAACPVRDWVAAEGRYAGSIGALVAEVGRRFGEAGVPLARISLLIRTLHPMIAASGFLWQAGANTVEEFARDHQSQSSEAYLLSPIRRVFEGAPGVRRRLCDVGCPDDFPILAELRGQGMTDYLVLPVPFSDGRTYAASFATDVPGGFDDATTQRLVALLPTLALVVEILAVRAIAETLASTYIGPSAGRRVLDGAIYRGVNEAIDAVIWISDLRGFTALSDAAAPPVVLGILNDHFERLTGAIGGAGGEVLKFMGDSLLAIFPVDALGGARAATAAALTAARAARTAMDRRNAERAARGLAPVRFGIGLHRGEVLYGNIGAPDRLDFTVIGPVVNHAARIENLCRTLDRRVLVSAAIAEQASGQLTSLGFHALRGVREPQEIFALADLPTGA
jgi:adenylate cyclase